VKLWLDSISVNAATIQRNIMKLAHVMYAWTPTTSDKSTAGTVRIGPHPDFTGWTKRYLSCLGACMRSFNEASDDERLLMMLLDFHTIVVRDCIDPQVAHKAFLGIDEYRDLISPDIEGASHEDDVLPSEY
jgi:hypothetical protein